MKIDFDVVRRWARYQLRRISPNILAEDGSPRERLRMQERQIAAALAVAKRERKPEGS